MKKFTIGFLALILTVACLGQIPKTLSYQGLLTDANGAPVPDGTHTVVFNFYTQETEGTPAFNRGPFQVSTFKGLFTAIIGNGQGTNNAALPDNFGDAQYWIGIAPDGQSELAPRAMLTAVPYAFRAEYASNVDGAAITSGTVPNERLDPDLQDLADGTLTGSKVGTGINATHVTTGTLPATVIPATSGVPIGTIVAYGSSTVPEGWLECDGSEVSRTTYSQLFAAIDVTWGAGDASTTFNLPDLRGRFLRGWDHGQGIDPDAASRFAIFTSGATGDEVGSYQDDETGPHRHYTIGGGSGSSVVSVNPDTPMRGAVTGYSDGNQDYKLGAYPIAGEPANSPSSYWTGAEARPKNAYVMYIIKVQ